MLIRIPAVKSAGISLLVLCASGCLGLNDSNAMVWAVHEIAPPRTTLPGSISYETRFVTGPIEAPFASTLSDRSTFRMEGRGLADPGPGFRYAVWVDVEEEDGRHVIERLGALELAEDSWLLERSFDPPRFIFRAAVALEPNGTESKRWTVFQNPGGIYRGEPGTYPLVAFQAYHAPKATVQIGIADGRWAVALGTRGAEPGFCSDFSRDEDPDACVKEPEGQQCAWLSGVPANQSSLRLVGCRRLDYGGLEADLEGIGPSGEIRLVVSVHAASETNMTAPSALKPVDQVVCRTPTECKATSAQSPSRT